MSENGKYTFTYWNIPGRGESIRALMAIGGLDFEENFVPLPLPLPNPEDSELIPFDDGTWGQMKNSTPWGSLPTLTLRRHLWPTARHFALFGQNHST